MNDSWNIVMLVAVILMAGWQIRNMIISSRHVKVVATSQAKMSGMVLFIGLFGIALLTRQPDQQQWYVLAGVLIVMILYIFVSPGLSDKGVFDSGKLVPYDNIKHYTAQKGKKGIHVMISTPKRDYFWIFEEKAFERAEQYFREHKVKRQEPLTREQMQREAEQRRRNKAEKRSRGKKG